MDKSTLIWITVLTATVLVVGSGVFVYLDPFSFKIDINGVTTAKYSNGQLKLYDGRSLIFTDDIKPYYYNGKGYVQMYKARGDKYSKLEYSESGGVHYVRQTILYSQGNLTRYFWITTSGIVKQEFEWNPIDPETRVYFNWRYEDMDKIDDAIVYFDSSHKETTAEIDNGLNLDWEKEVKNIKRVERFSNGVLQIRTRVYEGNAKFDPYVIIEPYVGDATIYSDGVKIEFDKEVCLEYGIFDCFQKINYTWLKADVRAYKSLETISGNRDELDYSSPTAGIEVTYQEDKYKISATDLISEDEWLYAWGFNLSYFDEPATYLIDGENIIYYLDGANIIVDNTKLCHDYDNDSNIIYDHQCEWIDTETDNPKITFLANKTFDPEFYVVFNELGSTNSWMFNSTEQTTSGVRLSTPKLYMNFNEENISTTVIDNSIYGYDGLLIGTEYNSSCGTTASGFDLGGCYNFNGNSDYINMSLLNAQYENTIKTISAWVYPRNTTGFNPIVGELGSVNTNYGFGLEIRDGKLYAESNNGGSGMTISYPISSNVWSMATMTINSQKNELNLYLNGQLVNSTTGTAKHHQGLFFIGAGSNDASITAYFNGSIDQVYVLNNTMSADGIMEFYNGTINNSDYIGSHFSVGDYRSFVFYNSTSTYWNTTLSHNATAGNNITLQTRTADDYNTTDANLKVFIPFNVSDTIIVDNKDPEYSEGGAPWSAYTDGYRNQIKYSGNGGTGSRTASWQFTPEIGGERSVWAWWLAHSNKCQAAEYIIYSDDGVERVYLNQSVPAAVHTESGWNYVGRHNFTVGVTYNITVTDNCSKYVVADAVMITADNSSMPVKNIVGDKNAFEMHSVVGITDEYGVVGRGIKINATEDSNDAYIVNRSAGLSIGSDLTMSMWYKGTSVNNNLFFFTNSSSTTANKIVTDTDGTAKFYSYRGAVDSNIVITDNQWHHLVAVNNATAIYAYIDGVYITSSATGAIADTINMMVIGSSGIFSYSMNGQVDDIRVYDRAFTTTEVQNLYQLENYHILWNDWQDEGIAVDGAPVSSSEKGKFLQFTANFKTNDSSVSPYLDSYNVTPAEGGVEPEYINFTLGNTSSENGFRVTQFINKSGTSFTLSGENYTLTGANMYYIADYATNLTYDDDGNQINNSIIYSDELLDKAQSLNINVMRTWANMMGGGCENYTSDSCWVVNESGGHYNLFEVGTPGNYSEEMYQALDYVIYEASKRDIRVMPVLINNWNEYGGMRWYVQQSPTSDKTYANVSDNSNSSWWEFHDQFYTDENAMQYYKDSVFHLLNRTNTYSGIQYKDDPTIFAWLLANEPRAKSDGASAQKIRNWTINMTDYIKSVDTNHLVGLGMEGWGINETWGEGTNFFDLHNGTGVDFATIALHPDSWDYFAQRSEFTDDNNWVDGGVGSNETIDFWTNGTGYTWNNRYTSGNVANWIPRLSRHGYDNWLSQNVEWANSLDMPIMAQEVAYPTDEPENIKDKFFQQGLNSFFGDGGDGFLLWNFNHDNYYYSTTVDGIMDDGYSYYYSTDPTLVNISNSVISAFEYAENNSLVSIVNNNKILFYYNVTPNNDTMANATLYINTTFKNGTSTEYYSDQTNTSIVEGENFFGKLFVDEAIYSYWIVEVCAVSGICLNTSEAYISTPPIITLNSIENGATINYTNVTLDYTVQSGITIDNCELYLNGQLNKTDTNISVSAIIYNEFHINISPIYSQYIWQVSCEDFAGNKRYSDRSIFYYSPQDLNITAISPEANITTNNQSVNFSVNITSGTPLQNIRLYIGGALNLTYNFTGTVYNSVYSYVVSVPEGLHTWFYSVMDITGYEKNMTEQNFTIKTTGPNVTFVSGTTIPGVIYQDWITANVTAIDDYLDSLIINLLLGETSPTINRTNLTSGESNVYVNFTGLSTGYYSLNATANDTLGNLGYDTVSGIIIAIAGNGTTYNYSDGVTNTTFSPVFPNQQDLFPNQQNMTFGIYSATNHEPIPGNVTVKVNQTQAGWRIEATTNSSGRWYALNNETYTSIGTLSASSNNMIWIRADLNYPSQNWTSELQFLTDWDII